MDDLSVCRSVRTYVRAYVRASVGLSSALWENGGLDPDRIRMPFGIVGRTGPGMRFGDRSTGRGTFGGEFGTLHCNRWGLCGVSVQQRRDAALFPNYFGQICYSLLLLFIYAHFSIFHSFRHLLTFNVNFPTVNVIGM